MRQRKRKVSHAIEVMTAVLLLVVFVGFNAVAAPPGGGHEMQGGGPGATSSHQEPPSGDDRTSGGVSSAGGFSPAQSISMGTSMESDGQTSGTAIQTAVTRMSGSQMPQGMNQQTGQVPQGMSRQMGQVPQGMSQQMGQMPQGTIQQTGQMPQPNGQQMGQMPGMPEGELPVVDGSDENPRIDGEILEETEEEGYTESTDYAYVSILGDVTDSEYEAFSEYMDVVVASDSAMVDKFASSGWEVILTSADLDELLFGGRSDGVEGCTYFNAKKIYVHAGEYSYCVVHEFGHYLDYLNGMVSTTDGFKSVYKSEAANLTAYGQTSPTEFFAEVYSYLLLEEDTVTTKCPQAAAAVESCRQNVQ